MKPGDPIELVSHLLDLPLVDCDGRYCGVVDDVEFSGSAGKATALKALLVGPGAYRGRLPRWAMWLTDTIAGDRVARVPMREVDRITTRVHLKCRAEQLKLHAVEDRVRGWIPRWAAL